MEPTRRSLFPLAALVPSWPPRAAAPLGTTGAPALRTGQARVRVGVYGRPHWVSSERGDTADEVRARMEALGWRLVALHEYAERNAELLFERVLSTGDAERLRHLITHQTWGSYPADCPYGAFELRLAYE